MDDLQGKMKDDLPAAVKIVLEKQGLSEISSAQLYQLECIVTGYNSLHQLPTGCGKTWAAISTPNILDVLRDKFHHKQIPKMNRVLYIVPLVAIISTMKIELAKFGISYEVIDSGHMGQIKKDSNVVILTPEKLVNKEILKQISGHSWSAIVIDESQYIITWGTSKKKKGILKRPFREAFQQLNQLNILGAAFELHTATASNVEKLFALLGRRDSVWLKQIVIPERENLTYYLIDGKDVSDIKQFPFVLEHLEDKSEGALAGALLIFVQKLDEGSKIFCSLNEYANENDLISWSSRSGKPIRPVAFLNANLTESRKEEILADVLAKKVNILVATSSVGAGVNLPFKTLLGWGLDPETTGLVQASGRVGQKPSMDRGDVIWVSSSTLGVRVPMDSPVRELFSSCCLRKSMNEWFAHGQSFTSAIPPEKCCSACMGRCFAENNCNICASNLKQFEPVRIKINLSKNVAVKYLSNKMSDFNLNEMTPRGTPVYDIINLAEALVTNLLEFKDIEKFEEFLGVFSLGMEVTDLLLGIIRANFDDLVKETFDLQSVEKSREVGLNSDSDDSESDNTSCNSEEYFDDTDTDSV